jgi:hypothetical protein
VLRIEGQSRADKGSRVAREIVFYVQQPS